MKKIRQTKVVGESSLDIVGLGIQSIQQTSFAARYSIQKADKVLYVVADPVSELWLKKLNPSAESLHGCYKDGEPRIQAYKNMVERILSCVRMGSKVTFVSYGHPSVFCFPTHEVSKRCKKEGVNVRVLPAISAEDCLFADLGFDPGKSGCQSFEATDFLLRKRKFDTAIPLVLWQIGVVGIFTYTQNYTKPYALKLLAKFLNRYYPPEHEVIVYEAAQYPILDPIIQKIPLQRLSDFDVGPLSTLFVPSLRKLKIDRKMVHELHLEKFMSKKI
jgi:uncharacterized protein YabN with tetrapyrrole methylase and pyrophosphatase domain